MSRADRSGWFAATRLLAGCAASARRGRQGPAFFAAIFGDDDSAIPGIEPAQINPPASGVGAAKRAGGSCRVRDRGAAASQAGTRGRRADRSTVNRRAAGYRSSQAGFTAAARSDNGVEI